MKGKHIRKIALIGAVAVILLVAFAFVQQPENQSAQKAIFGLQAPIFVSVAQAEADEITSEEIVNRVFDTVIVP